MSADHQSREAFEAWASAQGYLIGTDQQDDEYCFPNTHHAWMGWQASRKVALGDAVQELAGMTCNSVTARSAITLCIVAIKELK